jgi:hypothetical protein
MAGTDFVGVLIGGIIGIAGSVVPQWWGQRQARASAHAAVLAYISAVLKIEEIRQHATLYRNCLTALRAGQHEPLPRIFGAEDYTDADEMQKAIVGKIGLLSADVASDCVLFFNMLDNLRIDLRAIALGKVDGLSLAEKISTLEADLKLWDDSQRLGRDLIKRLGQ